MKRNVYTQNMFKYEAIQVLKNDVIQIHEKVDLMAMHDEVYEQH